MTDCLRRPPRRDAGPADTRTAARSTRHDDRGRTPAPPDRPHTSKKRRGTTQRDDRGETLALLIVWPALITAILLMLVHAFIVTNARAEAELAASQGLRSAWRAAADSDFLTDPANPSNPYNDPDPHPDVLSMASAAEDAVARAAATEGGWRWWTPGAAEVYSNWCDVPKPRGQRPTGDETGWVQVVVSGEVFGPLAALWPNRWDRIYAVAQGPALLVPPEGPSGARFEVPSSLLDPC